MMSCELSLQLLLYFILIIQSSSLKLIGDVVFVKSREPLSQERSLSDDFDILKPMLKKEVFNADNDQCLQGLINGTAIYGRCDIRKFPFCEGDRPYICFNRINRQDKFWPDKNPYYYIDYNRIHCYPDHINNVDFSCSSCSPGRWCMPESRCILDEERYPCW